MDDPDGPDPDGPLLLYVEDDAMVAMSSIQILEEAGFGVVHASDGMQAVRELEERCAEFKALVTDIRLPDGIDGWAIARRARDLCPSLPVVYVTGDSAVDWASQGVPNSVVVQKPFANAQLIAAVATLLNQPPTVIS